MKKYVTIAFYKADRKDATLIDKLIAWYTKGKYSHVEILLNIDNVLMQCSSSPRDGHVRCKPHKYNEDHWDYLKVPVENLDRIIEFYESIKGQPYDWFGILGFILPTQDRSDRWFCSETVANALKIDGFKPMWYLEPSSISPNRLYKLIIDYYGESVKERIITNKGSNNDTTDVPY